MTGFLAQVAADLWGRYGDDVASLSVVFPSRRASLFFGEALSEILEKPMWQPAAVTIDQVAEELSGLVVGERLRLVAELFKVYREFHPDEEFDNFYFWGELLLGDFDSIDKYLVDADMLFANLADLHDLDGIFDYLEPDQRAAIEQFWGTFAAGKRSVEQSDFLNIWKTLAPIYHRFKARLRELGIAYQGMVYREAAERIASETAAQLPERQYVIAGFNALSRCEQRIFEHLKRTARVDFYWDSDQYFTGNAAQEAGMFMRDNLRRFPQAGKLAGGDDNFLKPKQIRSIAAASDVLQCKWAGGALSEIANAGKETAVVLCDENLLAPLLWSMPPQVATINITMGYPLRMHPAYTFVERLVELQNRRRGSAERPVFYHSDVKGLLGHPYLAAPGSAAAQPSNFVYISVLRLHTTPLFEQIFSSAGSDWRDLSNYLIGVMSEVAKNSHKQLEDYQKSLEIFGLIVDHLRRLATSLERCEIELGLRTYARLLRRSLQSVTIPFEGEPLEGVQVMGILETRALDFENIIFLSAGDDRMPGNLVGAPSFIPYNLKAAYGLPTPEHHEGVYAYHFFRLISRARRIDLVWSRTTDEGSSGQPSRYVLQLDYESPHGVDNQTVAVDVNLSPSEHIVVEKDMERLPRRLSPSLFYTFVECPLKFYFRGVAHLRPDEEVIEGVDSAMLGNMLHRAMQLIYNPLAGIRDPRERIRKLIGSAEVEEAVRRAVAELAVSEEGAAAQEEWGGSIVLAHSTITEYINRGILPFDAARTEPFTIESLEQRIEKKITFSRQIVASGCETVGSNRETAPETADNCQDAATQNGQPAATEISENIIFGGIADRIDRLDDGTARVVDYKTGSSKNNASALLQMGLYAMILGPDTRTELFFVRDMTRPGYTPPRVVTGPDFEAELRATLGELFDPNVPFRQTPDPTPCAWCDFAAICRR